jgi:hypothetical protein
VDDLTGFSIWSHDAVKRWDGAIVHRKHWEPRHPQDTIRVPRETSARIPDARPEPVAQFVGPLITLTSAAASAGALTIEVETTARMQAGDHIGLYLASGDLHRAIIQEVTDIDTLIMTAPLPGAVESGATVIDYTALAVSEQE